MTISSPFHLLPVPTQRQHSNSGERVCASCLRDVFHHDDREIIGNIQFSTTFHFVSFYISEQTYRQHEKVYSGSFYIVIQDKAFRDAMHNEEQWRFLIARNCDCRSETDIGRISCTAY